MSEADALRAAIGMFHVPSRARVMKLAPLPRGVSLLLRLAADEADAPAEAQRLSGRSVEVTRPAAIFFIEQVLLCSEGDCYRILGLDSAATASELRRHMALLLKWLHPDRNRDSHRSHLAQRVIFAWDKIKTPDRRQRYDAEYRPSSTRTARKRGIRLRRVERRSAPAKSQRPRTSGKRDFFLPDSETAFVPAKAAGRLRQILGFLFRFGGGRSPHRRL